MTEVHTGLCVVVFKQKEQGRADGQQRSGHGKYDLGMQLVALKMQFMCGDIIPYDKAKSANDNECNNGQIDNRIEYITCERRK